MRKSLLILAGLISLALGIIGVIIPLLPTTPLLLLSAVCFFHSSDRLYQWLMKHRIFGNYIRNYREHRALTKTSKMVILIILWVTIFYTAFIAIPVLMVQIILFIIAVLVSLHILALKTISKG
ncbi:MAG: DUF454 domain-containing protein [Calditrichaeota bacterium]|nr:MAG: DUF454 domain-containing protein [Calditrichota bacterium]